MKNIFYLCYSSRISTPLFNVHLIFIQKFVIFYGWHYLAYSIANIIYTLSLPTLMNGNTCINVRCTVLLFVIFGNVSLCLFPHVYKLYYTTIYTF